MRGQVVSPHVMEYFENNRDRTVQASEVTEALGLDLEQIRSAISRLRNGMAPGWRTRFTTVIHGHAWCLHSPAPREAGKVTPPPITDPEPIPAPPVVETDTLLEVIGQLKDDDLLCRSESGVLYVASLVVPR